MAKDGQEDAIARWIRASGWMRLTLSHDSVGKTVGKTSAAFGTWFPGEWRGRSNFAPLKARLLQSLLGAQWYDDIYINDPFAIWIVPELFAQWKTNEKAKAEIEQNLAFCLGTTLAGEAIRTTLNGLGWARLLQAAVDFDLADKAQHILQLALQQTTNSSSSPKTKGETEAALLLQIY